MRSTRYTPENAIGSSNQHLSTKNRGVDLMNGMMGMGGWMMLWPVIGVLLIILLIVAIVKMAQKK